MLQESMTNPSQSRGRLSWVLRNTLAAVLVLAGVSAWGLARFGSIPSALAYARGDRLIPDARSLSFGRVDPGSTVEVGTGLTNHADRPIQLIGSNASCSCLLPEELPVVISPGGSHRFKIGIDSHARRGVVHERIVIFTDSPTQSQVGLTVSGEILTPRPSEPPGESIPEQ
ncbi:MAG: DUF1573 domain-containing protein [Isosphaeraceae bacterium]